MCIYHTHTTYNSINVAPVACWAEMLQEVLCSHFTQCMLLRMPWLPIHQGSGCGLSAYVIFWSGGVALTVVLC